MVGVGVGLGEVGGHVVQPGEQDEDVAGDVAVRAGVAGGHLLLGPGSVEQLADDLAELPGPHRGSGGDDQGEEVDLRQPVGAGAELQRDRGFALVVATHSAALARGCDRVLRIVEGRLAPLDDASASTYFRGGVVD